MVDPDGTGAPTNGLRRPAPGRRAVLLLAAVIGAVIAGAIGPHAASAQSLDGLESLDEALAVAGQTSRREIGLQQKIDALDDETREALAAYRAASEEAAALETYNEQLERLIASQLQERARIERQLGEIDVTKRRVFPFLDRMLEVLEDFVALDKPFLAEERALRISALREMRDRADVSVAEKFRRLIEAYQIEAEYGRTISADRETLEIDGAPTTVDVLRFGRVGLYYLTLDGARAGIFSPRERGWLPLDDDYRHTVREGLAIARKEKPPELVRLPIFVGAAEE